MNFKPSPPQTQGESARERILQAARDVFAEKGPEQATVREIISRAKSSNATLVKYFGNKDGLFSAYVAEFSARLAAASSIDPTADPEVELKRVGRQILASAIPEIPSYRAAMSAINKNPDFGPVIMEHSEAAIVVTGIAPALRRWSQDGRLRSDDIYGDAERFVQLLRAGVWERVLFARQNSASAAEIARAVDEAVRIFLYGIAPRPAAPVAPSRKAS